MTVARPVSGAKLAILLGIAALLFMVFAFGLRFMWFFAEAPLPPLLENLPDSRTEADQSLYLARARQAFPVGATEIELAAALEKQDFKVAAGDRVATYDRQAGLKDKCRRSGNLRWTIGADGRVSEIGGGYYQHCPTH